MTTYTRSPLALAHGSIDRAPHLRTDEAALLSRWRDPTSQVLVVRNGTFAVHADPPQLHLLPTAQFAHVDAAARWFLGIESGSAVFATTAALPAGRAATLRDAGGLLSDRDAGLAVTAIALEAWHATHRHCPACGAVTDVREGGMLRVCPTDGSEHYPRVDPAVIMAVVDSDDRLLLGHQTRWPERRFSTLAGFVEPGESLEQAVRREVREEVGITITDAHYLGSQPWPFPRSLMVGFVAHAATTAISTDGVEIAEARWFTRDGLADAVGTRQVLLPPRVSIARRLIEHWYGGPLDA